MPSTHALLPSVQHRYRGLAELPAARLHVRRERVFLLLAGLFLGTLAMLNILGITRFIVLGSWGPVQEGSSDWAFRFGEPSLAGGWSLAVAVGVLPYPVTFLCTDFISELYGRARANWVVFVGLLLNIWVVAVLWIGGVLPGFEGVDPEAGRVFFDVRALAFGAVTASMIAYVVAQFVDVQVFHFWKRVTNGKHLWLRNNGSTLISQLVDTVAVILITHFYARALPIDGSQSLLAQLLLFILTGYVFKIAAALFDTIPFYLGAPALARYLRLPPPTQAPHPPAAAAVESGVG